MRRTLFTMAVALLAVASVAAPPTTLPATREIKSVEVVNIGAGRVDEGFVRSHTAVRAGTELERPILARDVHRLLDTGLFTTVDVDLVPREEGVAVRFRVARKLTLSGPVAFTGSRHFSASKLRSFLGLAEGDLFDDQVLGVRTREIRREFEEDYYPDVEIAWDVTVVDADQGLARVTIDIDDGGRSGVKRVVFEGNTVVSDRTLRQAVGRPSWWNPLWIFRPRRYSPVELETMRLAVRNTYRDQGYLDVRVPPAEIERDDKDRQTIVFRIEEGRAFRFGEVTVEGVEVFPPEEIEALVRLVSGAPASAGAMSAATQRIQDFYGSHGYARARVRPQVNTRDEAPVADVALVVTEGELIYVGNIRIRGNTKTRDKVIRRELLVYPGDVLNSVKARRSERRLMNLGFFGNVRRFSVPTAVPNREDLVFDVEEKSSGQFLMGAGFSSVDDLIGFVEISQGNFDIRNWPWFTGGGQKLKLRAQMGSDRRDYELSFVEPWFLDRQLSLGLDFFRNDISYTDYDLKRTGGGISISRPLPGPHRVTFRYTLEDIEIHDIADTNEYLYFGTDESYFFSNEDNRTKSTLKTTLLHDSRDSPFIPTRGLRASVFGSLSGGPLGFDTEIYCLGTQVAGYVPLWWGHVFSIKSRYEVVDNYGGSDEVPINDRLFAGGGRTLRGYDYRDVGPKVVPADPEQTVATYRPVGGKTLFVNNLEYTIPIVDGIRLAGFFDIGTVWRDAYAFDAATLATSTGVGIRFDLPGFPIRVDWAQTLEKDDPLTQTDTWVIWIGYDY